MTLTVDPPAGPPAAPPRVRRSIPVHIPRKHVAHTHFGIVVNWMLVSLTLLFVWVLAFSLALSSFRHSHSQAVLFAKFREQLAAATAPVGGAIKVGAPVAIIDAPAAGLHHEVVVEGTTSAVTEKGPGHLRSTPLPGQSGTAIVFGRDKLFGGPFHRLISMRPGDVITVTTGLGVAKFGVVDVRHPGDNIAAFPTGSAGLTLVTAAGGGWRAGWASTSEVYVDAVMQGQPFPDPGGRPVAVPGAELPMKGDPDDALYTLVLWLPVLVLGGAGLVWTHHHWGAWQTWVVGVPILIAGLSGVSETATQFLPNIL